MVLGQSAATISCHAMEEEQAVQLIDMGRLQKRLLRDQQILEWTSNNQLQERY